jgi:hypothetical protein
MKEHMMRSIPMHEVETPSEEEDGVEVFSEEPLITILMNHGRSLGSKS